MHRLFRSKDNIATVETVHLKRPQRIYAEQKDSPLHEAARSGNLEQLTTLLREKKHDNLINIGNKDGDTPAHLAARGGHFECLRLLLNNPFLMKGSVYSASILTEKFPDITPLHELVKKCYVDQLDDSVRQSYRNMIEEVTHEEEKYYSYWLHRCAAKYGLLELMKELAPKVSPADHPWYPKVLPIEDAACANQVRVVDWLLIEYKHDNHQLKSLLYSASRKNAIDVVKRLLTAGADIDERAYMFAARDCYLDLLKCLIDHDRRILLDYNFCRELVRYAFQPGNFELIKYVLSLVSMDISDIARERLRSAAYNGNIEMLEYFIEDYKPERAITDKIDFKMCLEHAIFNCQANTLKWLVTQYDTYCKDMLADALTLAMERYETEPYLRNEKELANIIEFLNEKISEANLVMTRERSFNCVSINLPQLQI